MQTTAFKSILTHDELDRAARFRFSDLRDSFIVARGALRYLVGHYLNIRPKDIQFTYGLKGKPALTSPLELQFNMTHSGSFVSVALTTGCHLGIDLEQVHRVPDMQAVAERFFCREEAAEIMSLPSNERENAFFRCWTRKEAYVKAVGDGLSVPLDSFRVSVDFETPARFIHVSHDTAIASLWKLHDLRLDKDYAAALAYRGHPRALSIFPTINSSELLEML